MIMQAETMVKCKMCGMECLLFLMQFKSVVYIGF